MAKEKKLWLLVRDNLKDFHLQRIETGMTGSGVPDVNGCYAGVEFWLELKDVPAGMFIVDKLFVLAINHQSVWSP